MLLSVKGQIGLTVLCTALLSIKVSLIIEIQNLPLLLDSITTGIFVFTLLVRYETATGVIIVVDFHD